MNITKSDAIQTRIINLFKRKANTGVSTFRSYLLRLFYAMAVFMLGFDVWTEILTYQEQWEPFRAVAFSFWGVFSLLAILGIFHPLRMLPLLLVQFSYKLVWLVLVVYPLWTAGELAGSGAESLTRANSIGVVLDLLIIPWGYVFKTFVLGRQTPAN